jgi:hypothetical protein
MMPQFYPEVSGYTEKASRRPVVKLLMYSHNIDTFWMIIKDE